MMAGGNGVNAVTGDVGLVVFALAGLLGAAFLVLGSLSLSHGPLILGIDSPNPSIPIYRPLG